MTTEKAKAIIAAAEAINSEIMNGDGEVICPDFEFIDQLTPAALSPLIALYLKHSDEMPHGRAAALLAGYGFQLGVMAAERVRKSAELEYQDG